MLSLPDLKEKRIICIPSREKIENTLKFTNNNICLYQEGKKIDKISCHIVIAVFIIGDFTITSQLIKKSLEHGISFFFLNNSFKFYAEIMSKAEGNFKIRQIQYETFDIRALELSKMVVKNKIQNQFKLLKAQGKKPSKTFYLKTISDLKKTETIKTTLGIEGNYAKYYFKNIFDTQSWYRRAPQTKEDIPNFMLDIGYTFMFNFIDSLLKLFGFDTYKGFYHQLFFQRKSLSCDIMEPFRVLVDKQLIKSYNLKQINETDFKFKNGSFYFKDFKLQKKYTKIWFDLIMGEKEQIYLYVLDFYRYIQDSNKYKKPSFKIK